MYYLVWWIALVSWVGGLAAAAIVGYFLIPKGLGESDASNWAAVAGLAGALVVLLGLILGMSLMQRSLVRETHAFVSSTYGLSNFRIPPRVLINGRNFDAWLDALARRPSQPQLSR